MSYRLLGVLNDPNSATGGSTYDDISDPGPISYPTPTLFLPITTGNVNPGYQDSNREDEVRGRRGSVAPYSFRGAPTATFTSRLYPAIAKWVYPRQLGKTSTPAGEAPEAVVSTFEPAPFGGRLPAINLVMVREDQIDYLWGCWVETSETTFPEEGDPTVNVTLRALYHEAVPLGATEFTPDTASFTDPYAGVMMKAKDGPIGSLTEIDCLGSFSFTFNNTLSDDNNVRFCKGKNVVQELVDDSYKYRQYPSRHKLGRQEITGSLGFGTVQPTLEQKRMITEAEALQIELTGNPAGTTPESDELIRFTFHSHVLAADGDGAGELVQDGEITSSYNFSGHLDPTTNKDLEIAFSEAAAVALPD